MNEDDLKLNLSIITAPLLFVFLIWFIYWIEIRFGYNFNSFGVYPREISGLIGVIGFHFIHSDTNHLFNNSVPLLVLMSSLRLFYKDVWWKVLMYGGLLTGLITWIIARPSYHIGASGLVYLLFSFVCFSGIIKKHYRLVALSLIIIFTYGSMIWFILPIKKGMSWEGHLAGFLVGLFFAYLYRNKGLIKEEYTFQQNEFDELFDENGNLRDSMPENNENS